MVCSGKFKLDTKGCIIGQYHVYSWTKAHVNCKSEGQFLREKRDRTDNAAIEAINGWIKAELLMDLHVTGEKPVQREIDDYILFFNEQRPAYSLNYLTPKQYRQSNSAAASG